MSPTQTLISVGIGCLAGVIAALCGVGGGVVMVPAFVLLLALPQKHAVAASLMAMIPTAMTTTVKNQMNGLGDWKIALATGLAGSVIAWFASDWMKQWSDEKLTRLFGIVLVIMGVRMLVWAKA